MLLLKILTTVCLFFLSHTTLAVPTLTRADIEHQESPSDPEAEHTLPETPDLSGNLKERRDERECPSRYKKIHEWNKDCETEKKWLKRQIQKLDKIITRAEEVAENQPVFVSGPKSKPKPKHKTTGTIVEEDEPQEEDPDAGATGSTLSTRENVCDKVSKEFDAWDDCAADNLSLQETLKEKYKELAELQQTMLGHQGAFRRDVHGKSRKVAKLPTGHVHEREKYLNAYIGRLESIANFYSKQYSPGNRELVGKQNDNISRGWKALETKQKEMQAVMAQKHAQTTQTQAKSVDPAMPINVPDRAANVSASTSEA